MEKIDNSVKLHQFINTDGTVTTFEYVLKETDEDGNIAFWDYGDIDYAHCIAYFDVKAAGYYDAIDGFHPIQIPDPADPLDKWVDKMLTQYPETFPMVVAMVAND